MIIHTKLNFLHSYLVRGDGAIYCYVFSAGKSGISEKEPAMQEASGYTANSDKYNYKSPQPAKREVTEYVINKGRIGFEKVYPEDTAMIKTIRI